MIANSSIIKLWSMRDKCHMCKHRFEEQYILPVTNPVRGKYQPNFNVQVLFHMQDTHGIPADIVRNQLIGSIYGLELHEFGARGL